jgi:hypothetical protein
MNGKKNLLLLTATIVPKQNVKNLKIVDSKIRMEQYKLALDFYLKMLSEGHIQNILFVDNSASDCSPLKSLAEKYDVLDKVEFISFDGLDYPDVYGRGYGEFKLIQYAMENSILIKSLENDDLIWKVTGRYILSNYLRILKKVPTDFDFYCNCRNYPMYWIDLYVLCWKKSSYSTILNNIYQQLLEGNDAISSEQKFRSIIDFKKSSLSIVKRFNVTPCLIGFRGYDNQPYESGFKFHLRNVLNKLMPSIWI